MQARHKGNLIQNAPKKRKRSSNYQIGYGRPPKATQFKKGVSGNKKGRPKGSTNIASLFHAAVNERLSITESGQRRTISRLKR